MTTLKEFEDALREAGNEPALAILDALRRRDRARRQLTPARRVTGRKMTPDLAKEILRLHGSTTMTQQEIAFQLGVNQGRVNEVVKRGKWLSGDPSAPEAVARDRAIERIEHTVPASMMPVAGRNEAEPAPAEETTAPPVAEAQPAEPALFDAPAKPIAAPATGSDEDAPAAPAKRKPRAAAKTPKADDAETKPTPKAAVAKPAAPKPDSRQLSLGDF